MLDHFDLLAPVYDLFMWAPDTEHMRELLRLPTDGQLLDAGGGTARVSAPLRPLVGDVVVSDLSQRMLIKAQRKGRLLPVRAHAERLPFPDDSFDRVLVVDALHHFCDQREAIADLVRVLKPGGRLVIEEFDIARFPIKLVAMAERIALMGSRFYPPDEIRAMIGAHGVPAQVVSRGGLAAWIVADKPAAVTDQGVQPV